MTRYEAPLDTSLKRARAPRSSCELGTGFSASSPVGIESVKRRRNPTGGLGFTGGEVAGEAGECDSPACS